ncbi:MAG: cytochrome C peroxidase [Chitinophagaceae bacterium]|nr:cytochrome C peroxidase [Chitinophagaceae bacterium]
MMDRFRHTIFHPGYQWMGIILGVGLLCWIGCGTRSHQQSLQRNLHLLISSQIDSLYTATDSAVVFPVIREHDSAQLRLMFGQWRRQFKRAEWALEYFMPGTAKALNGAAIPEIEMEEHKELEPSGLQVVETFLYPHYDTTNEAELGRAVRNLHATLYRAEQIWQATRPDTAQWIDAAYYELLRVACMGITGFDSPLSLSSLPEAAAALQAVQQGLLVIQVPDSILQPLGGAIANLQQARTFESFDRAIFLRSYWQPAFAALARYRVPMVAYKRAPAVLPDAVHLFGNGFFNLAYFSPDTAGQGARLQHLGQRLFNERRLSANGQLSCATCHQPDKFFSDQQALSKNIHGNQLQRNTPGLLNAALQTNYFWDMRVLNLEAQAKAVIENANEMHGSLDAIASRLSADTLWRRLFQAAFGPTAGSNISAAQITAALAAYQRTLVNFDSPFDRYMLGADTAIDTDAIAGFNLFMGKAKCATCHFPPSFAGLVPPQFDKMESEVIGVPASAANDSRDADEGRFVVHPVEAWRHSFKTPTVRNVAGTFPYMHNGVYRTLEQVVDFYNKGGGAGLGLDYPNQTLPPEPLLLTAKEQLQLVRFMESLTSPLPTHR